MTMQRNDTLLHNGEQKIIYSQPLEKYFDANTRPNFISFNTSMTIRGYYAGWKIENGKLFLIDFVGHQLSSNWTEIEYRLTDLFKDVETPVFADWFSGDIFMPIGENISTSIYPMFEMFVKLSFDKGQLLAEVEVSAEDLTATNKSIAASGAVH